MGHREVEEVLHNGLRNKTADPKTKIVEDLPDVVEADPTEAVRNREPTTHRNEAAEKKKKGDCTRSVPRKKAEEDLHRKEEVRKVIRKDAGEEEDKAMTRKEDDPHTKEEV